MTKRNGEGSKGMWSEGGCGTKYGKWESGERD
jgi:hypothetical protein